MGKNKLDQQEIFQICVYILLKLSLTYIDGMDETEGLKRDLINNKDIDEKLAERIARCTFRAFKESGGKENVYFPLCAKYLA